MSNLEILKEIEKDIEICKGKIRASSVEEAEAIISNIENLIKQYQPDDDIEMRIIKNRYSDVDILKKAAKPPKKKL